MYSAFLEHKKTHAACDKNLNGWHQGIPWYGFWAVLVTQPEWLEVIRSAQTHMQAYLLPDYARQAHITLSASGLLAEQHFSAAHYQQQKQQILNSPPKAFSVKASHLNSFLSAPYLRIEDTQHGLLNLRTLLGAITSDDEPAIYHPHITLGFYREAFASQEIVGKFKTFKAPQLPELHISDIVYCRYRTDKLQSAFEVIETFPLSG